MQGDKQVIDYLNQVLTAELTAINQSFLHARMFKNWGINELNEKVYKKSIKDMKQADEVIERILFLEGLPNLQKLDKISIGEHTEEMLGCELSQTMSELSLLRDAVDVCEKAQDFVSRDVLVEILEDEEEYVDWLEAQQYLIDNSGIENYIQSKMS